MQVPAENELFYRGDGSLPPGGTPVGRDAEGRYLASPALTMAVNTAILVEQPLLVTGEPGTGKTSLAWSVASELGLGEPLAFYTRSDHLSRDILYTYDMMRRYYDVQAGDAAAKDPGNYVQLQALGQAIYGEQKRVVLIDEIDKAPRDFPNDLLHELDRMEFTVAETGKRFRATIRPIVIITSNSERQLPDAFLRRCVFHHFQFPSMDMLAGIVEERVRHLQPAERLIQVAIKRFTELRALPELEKRPATAELITWIRVLVRAGVSSDRLASSPLSELPYVGALVKTRHDLGLVTG